MSKVHELNMCGVTAFIFNIMLFIIYIWLARLYKKNQTSSYNFQFASMVTTWMTAHTVAINCSHGLLQSVFVLLAYLLFVPEWSERTTSMFEIQPSEF